MKKVVVETIVEERYEAEDGRSFRYKGDCEVYEKYYKFSLKELLSPYMSFDKWEAPLDGTWRGADKCFIFKEIPQEILHFLDIAFPSGRSGLASAYDKESWRLKDKEILYFCYDISDAMNGCGNAYWRFMGTKKSLNTQINACQRRIEEIENFEKVHQFLT